MGGGSVEPRWLIVGGVILLSIGYAILAMAASASRLLVGPGRLAFYAGLALLLTGVVVWLRRPPRPDPAEVADDRETADEI
jgi:uncharacterized membrane protein